MARQLGAHDAIASGFQDLLTRVHALIASGMEGVPALPAPTMRLLQQAARGETVSDDALRSVLEAAQRLQDRLGFEVLR